MGSSSTDQNDLSPLGRVQIAAAASFVDARPSHDRTLETLRQSEKRLRLLFDQDPDGIVILDPATARPLEFNRTAHQQLGYTREEFAELSVSDIEDVESADETRAHIARVLRQGRSDFETRHRTKTGGLMDVRVTAQVVEVDGHDVYHCIWRDITENKRVRCALELSEAKFATAFRTSPDAVNINRLSDGLFLDINEGFTNLTGYGVEDVAGKTSAEIAIWHDPADRERLVSGLRSDGVVQNLEARFRRKDGTLTTALMSARIMDIDGEPVILSVTRDISDRKRAEEEHRVIVQTATDGFWLSDEEGRLLEVNEAYYQMSGYSEQELLAMRVADLEVEETPDAVAAHIRRIMEAGAHRFESRHRRKDGTQFDVESSVTYLPEGGLFAAFQRDVTERNRLGDALRRRIVALTQPVEAAGGLTFSDLFDIEEIQSIQDDFAAATGVASIITAPDGTPITRPSNYSRLCTDLIQGTEKGRAKCLASDAAIGCRDATGPIIRRCLSAGLWDAGASIHAGGEHVANWLIAQVRESDQDINELVGYADDIGVDREAFRSAFAEIPVMPLERFTAIAQMMYSFARELSVIAYQNVQQARFITERARVERELADEQERGLERLQRSLSSLVEIVSHVAETRDPYTAGHQRRVSELAVRISQALGASAEQTEELRIAGLLHDIGKMGVPAEILTKPGRLSSIEFDLIKCHSEVGYNIIESAALEGAIAEIVYQHHERCDGSGYPRGLTSHVLLPAAKVLMVADVVEAMMSHRPYRPGLGQTAALEEIDRGAGTLYDASVAEACLGVFRHGFVFSEG